MKRTFLLLAFSLTVVLPGFSQSQLADSLYLLIKQHPQADTLRVNWLNELSEHTELMVERSDSLSRQALLLSQWLQYQPGEITALGLQSSAKARVGNQHQALELAEQALRLAEQNKSPRLIAQALRRLALVYRYRGEQQKALAANEQALKFAKKTNDASLVSKVYIELGLVFRVLGKIQKPWSTSNKA